MKRGSTIFLRTAVYLLGLAVLSVCVFALPIGIGTEEAGGYRWILAGLYVPAAPFFFALYQALKLLRYIDQNKAFSELSVTALTQIKRCGVVIGTLFAAALPYVYHVAEIDDAPGVLALGLIVTFASMVVAVFAAVLQKLLRSAIDIKLENDLTV